MRKIYNYILLAVLALAFVSCVDDLIDPNIPSAGSADDVQFGLTFAETDTRTIYGSQIDEKDENGTLVSSRYPIYWSEGDKVLVASPQSLGGENSAVYEVTPVSGQSYAEAMNKASDIGVRWGAEYADFYSIYPAANATWKELKTNEVIANLHIESTQSTKYVLDQNIYRSADMNNVIMYARTTGAKNGETVNLKYIPYSTILEFELAIAPNKDEQGNITDDYGSVKIVSMTLTAEDTPIAGDFTFRFDGDNRVVTAAGNNSDVITVEFASQPVLDKTNQKLYAKLSLIPSADTQHLDINGWTITVNVLEGTSPDIKSYTKTLSANKPLVPGQIHKIKLPKFSSTTKWTPAKDRWITQLYDYENIYLTELSLPGAWYSLGKNEDAYQAKDHTAKKLWDAGVRAFAVECRSATSSLVSGTINRVVISGTGNNTGSRYWGGTRINTVIKSLADQVASTIVTAKDENGNDIVIDGEFAVLVLSYADGGTAGQNNNYWSYFLEGIKDEITAAGVSNIYQKEITPSTTVKDVWGHLIIKVNVDNNITRGDYSGAPALLSYNPFLKQLPLGTDFEVPLFSKLYWNAWSDDSRTYVTESDDSNFWWCFSSANRTQPDPAEGVEPDSSFPTYAQRKAALRGMIAQSKSLTKNKAHNVWFYFNAGGTEAPNSVDDTNAEDARKFASNMNKWLLDIIRLKLYGGYDTDGVFGVKGAYLQSEESPLGIVMFNQCTGDNATYHGEDIISEIVEMNNRVKLLRAGADGGGTGEGGLGQ